LQPTVADLGDFVPEEKKKQAELMSNFVQRRKHKQNINTDACHISPLVLAHIYLN